MLGNSILTRTIATDWFGLVQLRLLFLNVFGEFAKGLSSKRVTQGCIMLGIEDLQIRLFSSRAESVFELRQSLLVVERPTIVECTAVKNFFVFVRSFADIMLYVKCLLIQQYIALY